MTRPPDSLELSRISSVVRFAGMGPLGCAAMCGLFALLLAVGVRPENNTGSWDGETGLPWIIAVLSLLSLGLGTVGVFLVCGRWGTTIDRRHRTATRWWGLASWRSEKVFPLVDVSRVELRRAVVHGESGSSTYYSTFLCSPSEEIPVIRSKSEADGRHDADRVAAFLRLELHDRTTGRGRDEVLVRRPDEIGLPVAERESANGEPLSLHEPPADLHSQIEPDGRGGLIVMLPRVGWSGPMIHFAWFCFGFVAVLTAGGLVLIWVASRNAPDGFPTLFYGFLLFPAFGFGVICTWLVIGAARFRQRVRVSPAEVRVTWAFGEQVIPAGDLKEIRVQPPGGIMIRSATKSIHVGYHLSQTECEHLAAVIRSIVAREHKSEGSPGRVPTEES